MMKAPTAPSPAPPGPKRIYRTPTLATHGTLRALTLAKGGHRQDSGQPKTRESGTNG